MQNARLRVFVDKHFLYAADAQNRKRVMNSEIKICEVCGIREAKGAYASAIAPVTLNICETCLEQRREPYEFLVYHLRGPINCIEKIPPYYHPIIEGTLKAENKTLSQFFKDCMVMEKKCKLQNMN